MVAYCFAVSLVAAIISFYAFFDGFRGYAIALAICSGIMFGLGVGQIG